MDSSGLSTTFLYGEIIGLNPKPPPCKGGVIPGLTTSPSFEYEGNLKHKIKLYFIGGDPSAGSPTGTL